MSELKNLSVLTAPIGQLSGDGQLRESVSERRGRKGADFPLWYIPPNLISHFGLPGTAIEAVVAEDPSVISWLKLRFGGQSFEISLDIDQLRELASDLPPSPTNRDICT